jgi:hypothetical protein
MYLLELSFYAFRQFLQIVLWISLPLIAVSMAVTVFLHYRRKKRQKHDTALLPEQEHGLPVALHVQPLLSRNDGDVSNTTLHIQPAPAQPVLQESAAPAVITVNNQWNDKPYKKDCLEDILAEKQQQLAFLQNQLDARIRNNWQESHEHVTALTQIQQQLEEARLQITLLEETLQLKNHEAVNYQLHVEHQTQQNDALLTTIEQATAVIINHENHIAALQEENSQLHATVADNNSLITTLEEQLVAANNTAAAFEKKWEQNSYLISRIYRELSGSLDAKLLLAEQHKEVLETVAAA